jgi:hypothetical protein
MKCIHTNLNEAESKGLQVKRFPTEWASNNLLHRMFQTVLHVLAKTKTRRNLPLKRFK